MKKLSVFIYFILLSCSKDITVDESRSALEFTLSVSSYVGGTVNYDNSTDGIFSDGEIVNISAVANENHYFIGWSNGSRENPIEITVNSNTFITAKFINKQDLITRFEQIVIGNGDNGPVYTLKWRQMNLFLDGSLTSGFKEELGLFVRELNFLLNNDEDFSINQVTELSDSDVHMMRADSDTFKSVYSEFEDIPLENYYGYALWWFNDFGNIESGKVFINSQSVSSNVVIRWAIRHELGHVLGLKHTTEESSIMHPNHRPGVNDVFSDLDKEALRFLHDERMTVFSNSDESREVLEGILGINNTNKAKNKPTTSFESKAKPGSIIYACGK